MSVPGTTVDSFILDEPRKHYLNWATTVKSWLFTLDHKRICVLYLCVITTFFILGGAAAIVFRIELMTPGPDILSAEMYNKMFTMHGVTMIFVFLVPSIPATPGVFIAGFASILTGVNFIVTVHTMRAPGMTWFRLPLFIWALYATSLIMVLGTPVIAIIGFFVWGHHLFVSSQSVYACLIFSFLSFLVGIPTAIKIFNWTATLYKGSISFDTPLLYILGFIGLFTIGGLTGLFLAAVAVDIHLHDTYFVVAHFHYVMVGGMVLAFMGGLHFWWPKMTGRMYNEFVSRIAAIIVFVGFNLTFPPQFILGYLGMPRRYHVYPEEWQLLHIMSTAGASASRHNVAG